MKKILTLTILGSMLTLASCSSNSPKAQEATNDNIKVSDLKTSTNIAYIRMDSITASYGLFMDLSDEFNKKTATAQKQYESKGRSLERKMADFQEKAQKGLVTRYEGQKLEEELRKEQTALMQYEQTMAAELSEAQAVLSNKVSTAILDYLTEYNADKKYDLILQTIGGSPVILGNPSLDITSEVLAELNRRYEDSLAVQKK